ncbi:TylF/MycF/NovP-related O-methyltransferase [Bradyrhizobium oligotrophicum]|uniref:TylF/MycF/NovP-related O-methyltransferase n=1 Tax=Bradyrhizobium oligotrophicum TaxID=44255 RepID=UPI003EB6AB7E
MLATYGAKINTVLNAVGLQLVRRSTLDRLISERDRDASPTAVAAPPEPVELAPVELDGALRFNEASHNFRKVPRNGEPVEAVPVWYLQNLQRESLALRDATAELVSLRLQLANAAGSPTSSSPGPATAPPQDGLYTPVYDHWGLRTDPAIVHNHDFMRDQRFVTAYERGAIAEGYDPKYFWRTHVALWCASVARALGGDFVECGVCRGMLSSSIMTYLDWNNIDRRFFLFDTFTGLDETQLTEEEVGSGNLANFREMYKEDIYERVVKNFAEFKNVEIVRGSVPSSLSNAAVGDVAYLSIDMNNATPEIAAVNYFWDKLQPGAPILLDDYGFVRYEIQKRAFDAWAAQRGVEILALPTGQGLILKPPG